MASFKQDMPPPGGYQNVEWAKKATKGVNGLWIVLSRSDYTSTLFVRVSVKPSDDDKRMHNCTEGCSSRLWQGYVKCKTATTATLPTDC